MARKHQYLCVFYGLIASVALVAIWSQNFAYFDATQGLLGIAQAYKQFALETRINPAARAMALDVLLLWLAGSAFMIFEARRLGIRFVWAYIALGFLLAISITLPLFLITRERHLAWHEGPAGLYDEEERVPLTDGIGLGVAAVVALCLSSFVIAG